MIENINKDSYRDIKKKQTLNQGRNEDGKRKILKISTKLTFRISTSPFFRFSAM